MNKTFLNKAILNTFYWPYSDLFYLQINDILRYI